MSRLYPPNLVLINAPLTHFYFTREEPHFSPHKSSYFGMKYSFSRAAFLKGEAWSSENMDFVLYLLYSIICVWQFSPVWEWLALVRYPWCYFLKPEKTGAGALYLIPNFVWIALHPWPFADQSLQRAFSGSKTPCYFILETYWCLHMLLLFFWNIFGLAQLFSARLGHLIKFQPHCGDMKWDMLR